VFAFDGRYFSDTAVLVDLPNRCFEEADHTAETGANIARIDSNEAVARDIAVAIHCILHGQKLLRCGGFVVLTAFSFDGSSIAEGASQKRHARPPALHCDYCILTKPYASTARMEFAGFARNAPPQGDRLSVYTASRQTILMG